MKIMLEELKHEERFVTDADTQIRTRAAQIMLVTSISLGIFAGLFEYVGKDMIGQIQKHQFVFIFISVPIGAFIVSLLCSYSVIKKRKSLMFSPAEEIYELIGDGSCERWLYYKLLKGHKKCIVDKNNRRSSELLPSLNNSTRYFIIGVISAVAVAVILLASIIIN